MSKGITIGGIIILIVGVVILIVSTFIHSIPITNVQDCQSFSGELGQFLDPNTLDVCERSASFIVLSQVGIIAGIVMIVIGGVISALGAVRRSSSVSATESGQVIGSPIYSLEKDERDNINGNRNQSPSKSDVSKITGELSKLLELKEKGALTEEEFARLKKELLEDKS